MSVKDFIYKENDNIYLNITFNSPQINSTGSPYDPPSGENPLPMEYNATKTLAVLDKCSDYYCSVVRFAIPMNSVPLFIMPIIPGNQQSHPVNANLTPMIIGILYNNVYYPVNLIYRADNTMVYPLQNQDTQVITPYYYVYTYQTLINMINVAINIAWTTSPLAGLFPTSIQPFFQYSTSTQLISLIVPRVFSYVTPPATSIPFIYMNLALLRYLESFELFFNGYNQPNGADFIFRCTNTIPLNPSDATPPQVFPTDQNAFAFFGTTPTFPAQYFIFTQQYSMIQYWSSLRKILITTGTIPIAYENIPGPDNSGVNVSLPVLTDFVIPLENAGDSRTIAYYNPTAQYRLVDMISDTPLYRINIKVYWEDVFGNRYPMGIEYDQTSSIKIGFFRKSLYKNTKMLTN